MSTMRSGRILLALSVALISSTTAVSATLTGPASKWHTGFATAQAEAKRLNRPILLHFYADWCAPCRRMERDVLNAPALLQQLGRRIVAVKVDSDRHPDLVRRFNVRALPSDVFLDPNGRVLAQSEGYQDRRSYLARLARVDSRFTRSLKVQIAKTQKSERRPAVRKSRASGTAPAKRKVAQQDSSRIRQNSDEQAQMLANSATHRVPLGRIDDAVGLKGYSPVALSKRRKWRKGKPELALQYQGIVYYLANTGEYEEFRADPGRYAPRLLGCDPVVLWDTDRAVPGSIRYGAYYDGELYLFVSRESRERFKKTPLRFTRTRHVLRAEQIERTEVR